MFMKPKHLPVYHVKPKFTSDACADLANRPTNEKLYSWTQRNSFASNSNKFETR